MKKTSIFLMLTYVLITANSCLGTSNNKSDLELLDSDFETIRINNEYSMEIPTFMKESKDLNDDASLQYQNVFKEIYVIVIDESKEQFKKVFKDLGEYNDSLPMVKNYKNIQLGFLQEALTMHRKDDLESSVINGIPFEIVEIDATIDGIDAVYTIAYVDGAEKVYMIMAWTEKDKKEKYMHLFQKMIKSFKVSSRSKGIKKIN